MTEWGISVGGAEPVPADIFASRQDAEERIWRDGGEELVSRDVTPWVSAGQG